VRLLSGSSAAELRGSSYARTGVFKQPVAGFAPRITGLIKLYAKGNLCLLGFLILLDLGEAQVSEHIQLLDYGIPPPAQVRTVTARPTPPERLRRMLRVACPAHLQPPLP
jgi:hypothetical protein